MCGVVKYVVSKEVEVSMAFLVLFLCTGSIAEETDMSTILGIISEGALCEPKVKIKLYVLVFIEDIVIVHQSLWDGLIARMFSHNANRCLIDHSIDTSTSGIFSQATRYQVSFASNVLNEYEIEFDYQTCITSFQRINQVLQKSTTCTSPEEPRTLMENACAYGFPKLDLCTTELVILNINSSLNHDLIDCTVLSHDFISRDCGTLILMAKIVIHCSSNWNFAMYDTDLNETLETFENLNDTFVCEKQNFLLSVRIDWMECVDVISGGNYHRNGWHCVVTSPRKHHRFHRKCLEREVSDLFDSMNKLFRSCHQGDNFQILNSYKSFTSSDILNVTKYHHHNRINRSPFTFIRDSRFSLIKKVCYQIIINITCLILFLLLMFIISFITSYCYHKMSSDKIHFKTLLKFIKPISLVYNYVNKISLIKLTLHINHRHIQFCVKLPSNCFISRKPLGLNNDSTFTSRYYEDFCLTNCKTSAYNSQPFSDFLNCVDFNSSSTYGKLSKDYYRRFYFLSLGDTHRPDVLQAYPVSRNSLNSYFESSLGDPSKESSLGFELIRLGTFSSFPGTYAPSSITLARAGFYFIGESDTVECFHCHVRYCNWNTRDDPFVVHRRISPSCGFINGQTNLNVPVDRCGNNTGPDRRQTVPINAETTLQNVDRQTLSESDCAVQTCPRPNTQSSINVSPELQPACSQNRNQESANHCAVKNETRNDSQPCVLVQTDTNSRPSCNSNQNTTISQNTQNYEEDNRYCQTTTTANVELVNKGNQRSSDSNGQQQSSTNRQPGRAMDIAPGHICSGTQSTGYQPLQLEPLGIVSTPPRYPAYAVLSVRMSTFQGWPPTSGQTPKQMATAGFIFAG